MKVSRDPHRHRGEREAMRSRFTFYFAVHNRTVSLVCRVDGRIRSWYALMDRKYAGVDLDKFFGEYPDPLQASLNFGLHLIDRDWIDCFALKRIGEYAHKWKHFDQCEDMGNVGFMYETECKLYPCATYVMEEGEIK